MTIFLIKYDRKNGKLLSIQPFSKKDRENAEKSRLQIELSEINHGTNTEVVILEAKDKRALKRTHRRYFEDLSELTN